MFGLLPAGAAARLTHNIPWRRGVVNPLSEELPGPPAGRAAPPSGLPAPGLQASYPGLQPRRYGPCGASRPRSGQLAAAARDPLPRGSPGAEAPGTPLLDVHGPHDEAQDLVVGLARPGLREELVGR